jgi:predicted lipid-binding transport protein (Tim44 family)
MFNVTNLLILALISAFIIFRLIFSLGKYEDEDEGFKTNQKIKTIEPIEIKPAEDEVSQQINMVQNLDKDSQIALEKIIKLEDSFTLGSFTKKAVAAFEYILNLYCLQKIDELKELVSAEVLASFDKQIKTLKSTNSMLKIVIVSITGTRIRQIKLNDKLATIKVDFESHQIEYKTDLQGNIISGNSSNVFKKHDTWLFSRNLGSDSPNWTLISTQT